MNDEMDFEPDDVQPWEDDAYETSYPEDCDTTGIEPADEMDGDHGSALASAGWGTDEDYDHYEDTGCEDW